MRPWAFLIGIGSLATAGAVTVLVLREAHRDLAAVRSAGISNGRRALARSAVRSEWARLTLIVVLLAAGIAAAVLTWDTTAVPEPLEWIPRVGYALSGIVIAMDGVGQYRARREIMQGYRQLHPLILDSDVPSDPDRDGTGAG